MSPQALRVKQVCCNTLTQYQLHSIDVFVRTAIKMHLTSVKNSNVCCSTWHLYFWGGVVSSLKLISKLQSVYPVLDYNCITKAGVCVQRQLLEIWIYFSPGKRWNPPTVRVILRSPCSRLSQRSLTIEQKCVKYHDEISELSKKKKHQVMWSRTYRLYTSEVKTYSHIKASFSVAWKNARAKAPYIAGKSLVKPTAMEIPRIM